MADDFLDLGAGHFLEFVAWQPDRILNPQYDGLPDVEKYSAILTHRLPTGETCQGSLTFESHVAHQLREKGHQWTVEQWDPLTLSPSILCRCGDHGFIREGRWEAA